MPADAELHDAQEIHHVHHVLRHGAFAIGAVVWQAGLFGGISIATQVGHDQIKFRVQLLRHAVPHGVCLRMTMKQQQGRTAAAFAGMDDPNLRFNAVLQKALKHPLIPVTAQPVMPALQPVPPSSRPER